MVTPGFNTLRNLFDIEKFARFIVRSRWLIVLLVFIITFLTGTQLDKLHFDTSITRFLPEHDPVIDYFREVDDIFEGANLTLIGLETNDVFTSQNLVAIQALTGELEKIPGLGQVTSLSNIIDIRKIEGGIEAKALIDPSDIPDDPERITALRKYVLQKDMYRGSIVSREGKATIIITKHLVDSDQPRAFQEIMGATKKVLAQYPHDITHAYFAGLTPQMHYIEQILIHDFQILVPAIIFLVTFVLFLNFRSLRGILLPLLTVLFATIWIMGTMAFLGRPLTLAHNTIPILLIAVGSAYGIHIVNRYYEEVTTAEGRAAGVQKTIKMIGLPVFLAGITTMIGFFSFITSTMPPFQEAGVFIALGIGFALLISLFFIPACLAVLRVRESPKRHPPGDPEDLEKEPVFVFKLLDREFISNQLEWAGRLIPRFRKLILLLAALVAAVCIAGLPRLTREVNFIEYFEEDNEYRIAEDMMMKYFGGSQALWIDTQADILNPFVLKEMHRFTLYLDSIPHSSNSQSIADLICETNYQMNGRYAIPDTSPGVASLWLFLEGNDYVDIFVKQGNTRGLIQSKVDTYDTGVQIRVVEEVGNHLADKVRKKIMVVDRHSLPLEVTPLVDKIRINTTGENLRNLLLAKLKSLGSETFREDTETILQHVLPIITRAVTTDFPLSSALRDNIKDRVIAYLESDESEIIVSNPRTRARIGRELSSVDSPEQVTLEQIEGILTALLPSLTPEEREMLGWMAESLEVVLQEEARHDRISRIQTAMLPFLPGKLKQDKNFDKYVRGILWSLDDRFIGLDQESLIRLGNPPVQETIETTFTQTGAPVLFNRLYPLLIDNMIRSIFIALSLVLAILIIQQRSLIGGLISITPISLTVLVNFGLMSYLGIPLDDSTMMIASIAIGIGIDYSIHFISRFQEELALGKSEPEALSATLRTTGKAILTNAFSVMMGFFVLVFSSVVPTQRFGWLTGVMMLVSSVSALTVLPALLLSTKMEFIRKKIPRLLQSKRFDELVRKQFAKLPGSEKLKKQLSRIPGGPLGFFDRQNDRDRSDSEE